MKLMKVTFMLGDIKGGNFDLLLDTAFDNE